MEWIIIVLILYFVFAVYSLIDKFIMGKRHLKNPYVYAALHGIAGILLLLILPFFKISVPSFNIILFSLVAGFFYILGLALFFKACIIEEITKLKILWQMVPVYVLILATIFLDEILVPKDYLAFVLLMLGGIIVSLKKEEGRFRFSQSFYIMVLTTFVFALHGIFVKYLFNIFEIISIYLFIRLGAFLSSLLLFIPKKNRIDLSADWKRMKINAKTTLLSKIILDLPSVFLFGYLMTISPISLVTALGNSVRPLYVLLLAYISTKLFPDFIKEDFSRGSLLKKIIALIIIIVGIYILTI